MHLKRRYVAKIRREEKNMSNKLFKEYFTIYQSPSNIYKKLREAEGTKNGDQVYLIKLKKPLNMCLKIKDLRLKRTRR